MRLLRRPTRPRTKAFRPAERYLFAGADEARRLGHSYVGTEHVLLALTRDPQGGATRVLGRLGVTHGDIRNSECLAAVWAPRIDPDALATLGIDLGAVRDRLEETFGPGALEQTGAGMLDPSGVGIQCVAPRLKQALADAVDRAGDEPVLDEHILLGMLSVPDSLAARALAERGVSFEAAAAIVRRQDEEADQET
jgi:ATP-dependent Clp protease ATP-binding subunit ClpA